MDYQKVIMSLLGDNKFETAKTVIDYLDQIHTKKEKISEIEKEIEDIQKKIDSLLSTKSDTQSTDIPESPESDISNSKSYMFKKKFSGASVGDNYIQETILRKNGYKFKTGDLLQPQQDKMKDSSYEFMIDFQVFNDLVKVGHDEIPDDDIVCYRQVKVEYSDELHRNVISHYADGNPILVKGVPFTILPSEDPEKFKGRPGDIIDYAFYLHPGFKIENVIDRGIVRWKYPVEDNSLDNVKTLETSSEKVESSQKKQKSDTTYKSNHQQLDLDLKGQSVLVLSDYARSEKLEEVIKLYNGKPTVTGGNNSSEQLPPMLEKLILGSDITIICTDYMHHRVSQQVIDVLKEKDDAKYAVASSSSRTFIERALYRAENGLQAYETSGSNTIDYPIKKD